MKPWLLLELQWSVAILAIAKASSRLPYCWLSSCRAKSMSDIHCSTIQPGWMKSPAATARSVPSISKPPAIHSSLFRASCVVIWIRRQQVLGICFLRSHDSPMQSLSFPGHGNGAEGGLAVGWVNGGTSRQNFYGSHDLRLLKVKLGDLHVQTVMILVVTGIMVYRLSCHTPCQRTTLTQLHRGVRHLQSCQKPDTSRFKGSIAKVDCVKWIQNGWWIGLFILSWNAGSSIDEISNLSS